MNRTARVVHPLGAAALVVVFALTASTSRPAAPPVPAAASAPAGSTVRNGHDAGSRGHAALRAVLDEAVRQGAPGALARVRQHGRVTYLRRGVADVATGERPRPDMHVRIGSITKTFVATVVLQLVDECVLDLDDTVDDWLPGLVSGHGNDGRAITVRMLLNHTSGLFDYTNDQALQESFEQDPLQSITARELVQVAVSHPPLFPPGTSWSYSDTNYVLLGMVIQAATGHSYAAEITRRVIRPLHLRQTFVPGTSPDIPPPYMHGYSRSPSDPARIEDVTRVNPSVASASGDMISTLADLDRFLTALLTGRLLPPATLRQMLTPTPGSDVVPGFGDYRYGFGIVIGYLPCHVTVYGNAGAFAGFDSYVVGTRDARHVLSYAFNADFVDQAPLTEQATNGEFCPHGTPHRTGGRSTH